MKLSNHTIYCFCKGWLAFDAGVRDTKIEQESGKGLNFGHVKMM